MTPIEEHGPVIPGKGERLVELLQARDGRLTHVTLATGERLEVYDIAWGRDLGADWEHVTTNCSPPVDGRPVDLFMVHEIVRIEDPETGAFLFERSGDPDARKPLTRGPVPRR